MIKKPILIVLALLFNSTADARVEFEQEDLESWADATFSHAFADRRFSGMVVTLVQDGEVKLSKGFGYADYEAKTPVDPGGTRFMIASISKTFTATAMAQLVDRGLIDSLDDPANKYLKRMQIPESFGKQVTLWNLLTHRAGYEDYLTHAGNLEPDIQVPFDKALIASMTPAIVREPGSVSVYSNFSTSVLGLLIEDVTGITLNKFMKKNIFEPLWMEHTELRYSSARAEGMGVPYAFFPNGESQRVPHLAVHPLLAPAGAIVSTADDMTRYMMAHLDAGRSKDNAILSPEMFDLMHARHVGNHPDTSGIGMTFLVNTYANQAYFSHGGGWLGWYSIMVMFPESNAGYFAAVMADPVIPSATEKIFGGRRMQSVPGTTVGEPFDIPDLIMPFAVRYFGPPQQIDAFSASDKQETLPGTYWRSKRSYTRMDAFFELLEINDATIRVESVGDDALEINGRGPYRPVSNSTFGLAIDMGEVDVDGPIYIDDTVTFIRDGDNDVISLLPSNGMGAYGKVGALQNPQFMLRLLAFSVLVGLTGFFMVRWSSTARMGLYGKWFAVSLATALILVIYTIFAGFGEGEGWLLYKLSGRTTRFMALAVLGNIVFLLSLAIVVIAALSWVSNCWGVGRRAVFRRVHYSLLAFACLGLILVLSFVNMIGFHLPV